MKNSQTQFLTLALILSLTARRSLQASPHGAASTPHLTSRPLALTLTPLTSSPHGLTASRPHSLTPSTSRPHGFDLTPSTSRPHGLDLTASRLRPHDFTASRLRPHGLTASRPRPHGLTPHLLSLYLTASRHQPHGLTPSTSRPSPHFSASPPSLSLARSRPILVGSGSLPTE